MAKRCSDEALIEHLADVLEEDGDVSAAQFQALPERKFSRAPYEHHFGGWVAAKKVAKEYLEQYGRKVKEDEPKPVQAVPSGIEDVTLSSYEQLIQSNTRLSNALQSEKERTRLIVDSCVIAMSKINHAFKIKPGKHVKAPLNLEFHALRSDAQVGEKVEAAEVQGISEYNYDIYQKRLHRWIDKILLFKDEDVRQLGLNKLVIAHLGDQVEGEMIYPGQAYAIDALLVDQLMGSVEHESKALLTLAHHFETIEVYCVSGNHGRIGKKGDHSQKTNMDYLFYQILKQALVNQPNIHIFISESPLMAVQHGRFNFAYKHGQNVRSWMGIPFYGLERDYNKLQSLYDIPIHYELVGHFHQSTNIRDQILINGTMVGGSNLSINQLSMTDRPSQRIFYFDLEEGINRESNLYLADRRPMETDDYGIYTEWS